MLFGKLSQWEIHHYLESIRDMRYCCFLGEGAVSKFRNMESMTITHASPNVHKLSWVGRHMPLTCPSKYSTGTWQCNTAAIPNSEYHFLVKHGHNKTKKYECFWCFLWHKSSNFRSRVSPIGTANVHSLYYTFLSTQSTRKTYSDFWRRRQWLSLWPDMVISPQTSQDGAPTLWCECRFINPFN